MNPLVSIVIPIYHDRAQIGSTIDSLAQFLKDEYLLGEIIVVNDGGADGGAKIVLEKIQHYKMVRFINRNVNLGKGYTVREGVSAAYGTYIFFTDADLPYTAMPVKKMLALLQDGEADLTLANRNLVASTEHKKANWLRGLTHRIYSHFVRFFIPIPFTDTLAGLKGMTREVATKLLPKLSIDRWSFDVELLLAAQQAGFKIKQVAVSLKNVGQSNLQIHRDAPAMIKEILTIWKQYRRGQYN